MGPLAILLLIAAIVLYFVFLRRKKPEPTHNTPKSIPPSPRAIPAPKPSLRPFRLAPPPAKPIKTASGHTYVRNADGTYNNTNDGSTVTWLMLYLMLSDADRADYQTPDNYFEGMTFTEAQMASMEELTGHAIIDEQPETPAPESTTTAAQEETFSQSDNDSQRSTYVETERTSPVADPSPVYQPDPTPSYTSDTSGFSSPSDP